MSDKLTPLQERFVLEYMRDLNATQAYLRAGYKCTLKSAESHSSRLVRNGKVAAAIAAQTKTFLDRLEITAENLLRELGRIAFADPARMFDVDGNLKRPDQMDEHTRAAVASYRKTDKGTMVKFHPKVTAIEIGMRYAGLLKQNEGVGQLDLTVYVGYDPARYGSRILPGERRPEALPAAGSAS